MQTKRLIYAQVFEVTWEGDKQTERRTETEDVSTQSEADYIISKPIISCNNLGNSNLNSATVIIQRDDA